MYKLITAPSSEPISLTEAKAHLRVTGSEEDDLISNLIIAVRNEAESYLNRVLILQVWDLYLDCFPEIYQGIEINKSPIKNIEYIKYYDSEGALQTWDTAKYDIDRYTEPARIYPAYGEYYPVARFQINAVQIRFTSGYDTIPEAIKSGMYLYLGYLYDNRGDTTTSGVPRAVWNIWDNYRVLCI